MNTTNFNSAVEPVFKPTEFGSNYFENQRKKWQSVVKEEQKKSLPEEYAQQEGELDDDDKDIIQDKIEQVRPPYESFYRYIKLKDMVSILEEIWEDQDD